MNVTIDRLRDILELEQTKGYRDLAVMGGLDRFLCNVHSADPKLSRLISQSYSTLAEKERAEWIKSVLKQLDAGNQGSGVRGQGSGIRDRGSALSYEL